MRRRNLKTGRGNPHKCRDCGCLFADEIPDYPLCPDCDEKDYRMTKEV